MSVHQEARLPYYSDYPNQVKTREVDIGNYLSHKSKAHDVDCNSTQNQPVRAAYRLISYLAWA